MVLMTGLCSSFTKASAAGSKSIGNDFLVFSVNDDTGYFSIHTREGHPQKAADNDMSLLYDGDSIETSFTTVRIDGKDYIFGQDYGFLGSTSQRGTSTVDAANNIISTKWTIHGIEITQKAKISRTDNTSLTGNVNLAYEINNKSGEAHNVGIRVLLDNSLGEIDAPVVMAESELAPVIKETEFFTGRDPGDYIRFIDSFEQPSKEAYLSFSNEYATKPDSVITGHWYHLATTKWDYAPNADFVFDNGFNDLAKADTATVVYFNEQSVPANGTLEKGLVYGIGDFTDGFKNSEFNMSLEILDKIEVEGNGYKNDGVVNGIIHVYNNVDLSEDIENAELSLFCEDGLEFMIEGEETDPENPLTSYEIILGYIPKGSVVSYPVKLRAKVQPNLTALEVVAKVTGNDPESAVTVSKYILAPSVKGTSVKFSIEDIEAKRYHISGQRALSARGIIPKDFMDDKTKWKAAFVNMDYPNIRYEIDSDNISVNQDNLMSILYHGDMVIGNYCIEVTFFEDYKDIFVDVYTSNATFAIVDDPSLAVQEYGILAVVRAGASTAVDYSITAMNTEEQLAAFRKQIAAANVGQSQQLAEIVLVLKGVFVPQRDSYGNVEGYAAAEDNYVINDIIRGKKGDIIEYTDVSFDQSGKMTNYAEVLVSGEDGYHINSTKICNGSWEIRLTKNHMQTLADRSSIRVDFTDPLNAVLVNLAGFVFNFKFAALGYSADMGYTANFGGKIMLSYYFKDAPVPTITDAGYQPQQHHTPSALTANKMNLYASADVQDVVFNKDGFYGIKTTIDVGIALSSLIKTVRKDTFMLHLEIDTFNEDYYGTGTITIRGYSISMSLGFKVVYTKNGYVLKDPSKKNDIGVKSDLMLDDIYLSVTVPPTSPVPIYPPVVSLTRLGGGIKNLTSAVPPEITDANDFCKYLNNMTAEIGAEAGILLFRIVSLDGFANFGINHFNATLVISGPKLPGLTLSATMAVQWKYPEQHEDKTKTKFDATIAFSLKLNVFSIFIGDGKLVAKLSAKADADGDVSYNPYISLALHGGLFIPAMLPIIGGMEVVGAEAILDTTGVIVTTTILNNDIVFSYNFDDSEGTWLMDENGENTGFGVSNMQVLKVEGSENAQLLGENAVSGVITSKEGRTTLIAVKYRGNAPDVSKLRLTVDGDDRPLTVATEESGFTDGNIFVMPANDGEGKIYFGTKGIEAGKHEYILTSENEGTELEIMEAASFARGVRASEVTVNEDDTITVRADRSLLGSNVRVYAVTEIPNTDDIITEKVLDENGNVDVNVYKMIDGEKVPYSSVTDEYNEEYLLCETDVREDVAEITLPAEPGMEVPSGTYFLRTVVTSPHKASTQLYSEATISVENDFYPDPVTEAVASNGGNRSIRLDITEPEKGCEGYFVVSYPEDGNKFDSEVEYFSTDEDILIEVEDTSKKYTVEIEAVKYDDASNVYSSNPYIIKNIEVAEPETVNTSVKLDSETIPVEYESGNGSTDTAYFIKNGNKAIFTAVSDEPVYGTFVIDGMEAGTSKETATSFTYEGEFDDGTHTVGFIATKENGDKTYARNVSFEVETDKPALMVDEAVLLVENGSITVSGISSNTQKIVFAGKEYKPAADGTFSFSTDVDFERFANRYEIRAYGISGLESVSNILAVKSEYQPIDRIEIRADGEAAESITLEPGKSVVLSAPGFAGETQRDVSDTVSFVVVNGNSSVVFDESTNTLKATAPGTAYVKAVYDMGRYISDEVTGAYIFEDMLEVNVMKKSPDVISSHPNGAKVTKNTNIILSAKGAEIRYTTNGTEPGKDSKLYNAGIKITEDTTIKARSFMEGHSMGDVFTYSYSVRKSSSSADSPAVVPSLPSPGNGNASQDFGLVVSDTASGTVKYGHKVTLINNVGGTIYYTTDGTTPDNTSIPYGGPVTITDNTVIKAVSYYGNGEYGKVYEFIYTVDRYFIRLRTDMRKELLINGYPDGTFKPDNNLTRAETATLLRRAVEMQGYKIRTDIFSDVDMWAKDSINELASASVVNGYPDGTFKPDNSVTRAEFITMLMRIIGETGTSSEFSDVKGHWAEKHIAKAAEYGYIGGYPDGTLRPDNNITRAEALVILSRVFGFDNSGSVSKFADVTWDHWAFGYIAD